jgi:hypothetical protein
MGGSDTSTIRKVSFPFFWKSSKYDPRNVKKYRGWEFETYSDSSYGVTEDDKSYGDPSTEGADIDLICGIKPEIINSFGFSEENRRISKKEWDKLIMKYGEEIRKGLHLVLSFTSEYENRFGHSGFYSSVIRRIHRGKGDKRQDN